MEEQLMKIVTNVKNSHTTTHNRENKVKSLLSLLKEIQDEYAILSELIVSTGFTGVEDNFRIREGLNTIIHQIRRAQDYVIKVKVKLKKIIMSIGEHRHPQLFQGIQLNSLFLFSQNFSYTSNLNEQAIGTVNVFQFADFDGLNIYFGFVDFSVNTISTPTGLGLFNQDITPKATIPPKDNMFGFYKGIKDNELDFGIQQMSIQIKPGIMFTSGGTAI
jgi:hypothetical protein